jgi:F420-non-reducing hydrogenase iron-sulfur subunit
LPSRRSGARTKARGAPRKKVSAARKKAAPGAAKKDASGAARAKAADVAEARAPDTEKAGDKGFEPRVVAFACNWCSYPAADAAGINKMQYPPNARIIRVMCAGRIHPAFVLRALELGADGVLVSGCHFADCHYLFGAKRAAEQFEKTAALVRLLGIESERVRFEQISAAEAPKFVKVMNDFVADLRRLGRSPLAGLRSGELAIPDAVGEERT